MARGKLTEIIIAQKLAKSMIDALKNDTNVYNVNIIEYYFRKALIRGAKKKYKTKSKRHNTKKVPVIQLNSLDVEVGRFDSYADAERATEISKESICMVCNGKNYRYTAGGYYWKINEEK